MRNLIITRGAWDDISDAWLFYEKQERGAGDYFEQGIKADIQSLAHLHGIHRFVSGHHRMGATSFPYAIYYRDLEFETRVVAVLDTRRDPAWIMSRLRNL